MVDQDAQGDGVDLANRSAASGVESSPVLDAAGGLVEATSPVEIRVGIERAGERLDRTLAKVLGASRADVRRLLARGGVSLDGRVLDASAKGLFLEDGATLRVAAYRPPHSRCAIPEPEAPLSVIARGEGWLALDKPAGVAVHPLDETERGTLLGALLARHPEVAGVGEGGLRSGVVHRLDLATSGVLLMATTQPAWERLRSAFKAHRVDKTYRALVAGRLDLERGMRLPLVVAQHKPARVRVVDEERAAALGATMARQHVRPLVALRDATLVEVRLETGFLHQIRATLAHIGHPVLGDTSYADDAVAARAPRQMLHAASVRFEEIAAESDDPEDFHEMLEELSQ